MDERPKLAPEEASGANVMQRTAEIIGWTLLVVLGTLILLSVVCGDDEERRQKKACAPFAKAGTSGDLVICLDADGGYRVVTVK